MMYEGKRGFITTTEGLLVLTVCVIALMVGFVSLRNAVSAEAEDLAEIFGSEDQSFSLLGVAADNQTVNITGSAFPDQSDDHAMDALDGKVEGGPGDWTFAP